MRSPSPRSRASTLLASASVALLVGATAAHVATPSARADDAPEVADGEVLVRFRPGATPAAIAALCGAERLVEREAVGLGRGPADPGLRRLRAAADGPGRGAGRAGDRAAGLRRARALAERLARHPLVAYAEPNYVIRAVDVFPNDTRFAELWGLHNTGSSGGTADADIDAPQAWEVTTGDPSLVVAIIDTGIVATHPDLAANVWVNPGEIAGNGIDDDGNGWVDDVHGINAIEGAANPGNPHDDNGHGTHCAGTIGAVGNNARGVVGVAWQVRLMALKVLDANGYGTVADAVKAFEYANRMKHVHGVNIRITNNSWSSGGGSLALREAMLGLDQPGMEPILHAVAAGNASSDVHVVPAYPAAYDLPNQITVAATDRNDLIAGFSSYGSGAVHLSAPGVAILSTVPQTGGVHAYLTGYRALDGTSMATPHVAGAAALLAAAEPTFDAQALRARLVWSTDPIWMLGLGQNALKPTESRGRLNAGRALTVDDALAPAAVGDLAVVASTMSSATLTWTATGDDGMTGTARGYDLRYAAEPITEATWASAARAQSEPIPGAPGAPEAVTVTGLLPLTTWHFALRVMDEAGHASPLSNLASAETTGPLTLFEDDAESVTGGLIPSGLWHRSTEYAASPVHAWRYADPATGDLGPPQLSHMARLSLPAQVRVGPATALRFRHRLARAAADWTRLLVSSNEGASYQVLRDLQPTGGAFVDEVLDLAPFAGADLRLAFEYVHLAKPAGTPVEEGWAIDDVVVVAARDETDPPAAVADLAVAAAGLTHVTLTWTAPGDDGGAGTAHRYDIRYSATPFTEAGWDAATMVYAAGEPTPQPAGALESYTLGGLAPGSTVYVALVTRDGQGNVSGLSNVVEVTTATGVEAFADDMEAGAALWTTAGEPAPSLWHLSTLRKVSGATSWWYAVPAQGNYDTGARNWGMLTTAAPIDLAGALDAALLFWEWRSTEYNHWLDRTRVEVSADGGATWALAHETLSPSPAGWFERRVRLDAWLGQAVLVRFHFDTVDATQNFFSGWHVDDVRVLVVPDEGPPPPAPVAAFEANATACPGEPIAFLDGSTGAIDGWSWDFGDGAGSTDPSPTHAYAASGVYAVTLTVTGPGGADATTRWVEVLGPAPAAAIAATPTSGAAPLTVAFADASSGAVTSRLWLFGDGQSSTASAASHTYATRGTYQATLSVSGDCGADDATETITVHGAARVVSITFTRVFGNLYTVRATVRDEVGAALAGASVTLQIRRGSTLVGTYGATTNTSGVASMSATLSSKGCYAATVTAVTKSGFVWDGATPANQMCK